MHAPFNKAGLRWEEIRNHFGDPSLIPVYKGEQCIMAARAFFRISYKDAGWLFSPGEYNRPWATIGPQHVIRRVRALLRRDQKARE